MKEPENIFIETATAPAKRTKPKKIETCQICDEQYNKSTNKKVDCPYCEFGSCRKCCETYILGETLPKCMSPSCGKTWTRKFLVDTFTKNFVSKTLKEHRENILFDQERALLPATQIIVEQQIQREKLAKRIHDIDMEIRKLKRLRYDIFNNFHQHADQGSTPAQERRQFIRACPDGECRGFLSSQWKCGICEKWTCPDCHVIKGETRDEEHTCNPDDLATAQLLAQDTKPCPQCATGIFKIEGCDQMWCTQCHTAFSWRTGRIESNIHNPHYYEWMRRTGGQMQRNYGDIQCGRELNHHFADDLRRTLDRKMRQRPDEVINSISKRASYIIESIIHLRQAIIPEYRVDHVQNNETLRVMYMRNQIDETAFKVRLQRDNKKYEKRREIFEVLQMFITTATDVLYRYSNEIKDCVNGEEIEKIEILDEVDRLVDYVNECLVDVSKTYATVAKRIKMRSDKDRSERGHRIYNPVLW